jgi:hypothetical protein
VNLNLMQQRVLTGGVIALTLMALFPPWKMTYDRPQMGTLQKAGSYEFIGTPPSGRDGNFTWSVTIDFPRLLVPAVAVLVVTGAGILFTQGWKPEPPQKNWNKPDTSIKVSDAGHSPAPDARS